MALICVYVRKTNYFDKLYKTLGIDAKKALDTPTFGFSKALNGFMMMITQTGKLLFISENAAEYLGHSMEDLLIHGDSIYDIIDKQDHGTIQSELIRGSEDFNLEEIPTTKPEKRIFLCHMNVSRNARRQMRFGNQKVIIVEGHYSGALPLCSRNDPVFIAWCTPVAMPETRECVVQGATNIFTSVHSMDLKIIQIDSNGEHHLGYTKFDLQGVSWYHLLHPDSMKEVQNKHRLITQSENDRSCILLLRLQKQDGSWLWIHTVIQVKDNLEDSQTPVIVCTNQVLNEAEARIMRSNSWLYHYYMVQSRLQYGLAYGAPPSGLAAYYPHMLGGHQPQHFPPYDQTSHSLHSAYLQASQLNGGALAAPTYSSYAYTPPAGAYHLAETPTHHIQVTETKDHTPGPLDFSKTPSWQLSPVKAEYTTKDVTEDKRSLVQWENYLHPQDLSSSKQSSPSWRSDSSGSPLHLPPLDPTFGGSGPEVATMSRSHHSHLGDRLKPPSTDIPISRSTYQDNRKVPEAFQDLTYTADWRTEQISRHQLCSWSDNQMSGLTKLTKDNFTEEDAFKEEYIKNMNNKVAYNDSNNNPSIDNADTKLA